MCHSAEYLPAMYNSVDFISTRCHSAMCNSVVCHPAELRCAECCFTECCATTEIIEDSCNKN